jgi:hypothetical protein
MARGAGRHCAAGHAASAKVLISVVLPHIAAEELGYQAGQTHRTLEDHGRRGPQACRNPALHLDRRHRVQRKHAVKTAG